MNEDITDLDQELQAMDCLPPARKMFALGVHKQILWWIEDYLVLTTEPDDFVAKFIQIDWEHDVIRARPRWI